MDGLLPIIIIIIIGIFRALSGGNQNEKQQQKQPRPNVPRPTTATPSGGQTRPDKTVYQSSRTNRDERQTSKRTVYQSEPSKVYLEGQQKQQMEQLKQRMNTSSNITVEEISEQDTVLSTAIKDTIKHQTSSRSSEKKEAFKKDVQSGLNHKGLVQGIIMSEVLGPSRARKPYQNVIQERKRYSR